MLKGTHGHYRQYSSKLLAGGSNPPGRAMELSGGYMHARVYPLFLSRITEVDILLWLTSRLCFWGNGPHMRMEGTRKIYLEFLSVLLGYQLFITDIDLKRQLYLFIVKNSIYTIYKFP